MRLKPRAMTPRQEAFAEAAARTGDPIYAAEKAGYRASAARQVAWLNMRNPVVNAAIVAGQTARLHNEIVPAALSLLAHVLDEKTGAKYPIQHRITAAKVALGQARTGAGDAADKEPHEMTAAELEAAWQKVRDELASRATTVVDVTPTPSNAQSTPDIFE